MLDHVTMGTNASTCTNKYTEPGTSMEAIKDIVANLTIPKNAIHSLKEHVIESIVHTSTNQK